ncbi:hypothetical protein BTJ45_04000 [Bacillus mycoides]|nr:hypothetical protein BTJ45_04000 [Bacillus mycoides]
MVKGECYHRHPFQNIINLYVLMRFTTYNRKMNNIERK